MTSTEKLYVVFAVQLSGRLCNITWVFELEPPWHRHPLFAVESRFPTREVWKRHYKCQA